MSNNTHRNREILSDAHDRGTFSTLFAFLRLSGPGWLQAAITLGGGSLIGALYLGMLGGTSMLWLQLVAIAIGVIMLSAISYVTLSTKMRPYAAINEYVNPVLGVGWITATILANMIWIIPQFALCYDALDKNLLIQPLTEETRTEIQAEVETLKLAGVDASESDFARLAVLNTQLDRETSGLGNKQDAKMMVSGVIAVAAFFIVMMSFNPGWMATFFDVILKLIVGMIVICFVLVVYYLATSDALVWQDILMGFVPNINHWNSPAPDIQALISGLDGSMQTFWEEQIVKKQQEAMIGVTATAVGLNMTFLLPYSMLARGWDKPFRGLARFDLITAMAIPYLVVTTCIVIASAHAFHGKADPDFLSNDPAVMQTSVLFKSTFGVLENRYAIDKGDEEKVARLLELNSAVDALKTKLAAKGLSDEARSTLESELKEENKKKQQTLAEFGASLSDAEKRLAPTLVKPNAAQLAATLKPLLGEENRKYADLIFGLGALGMGFSTIIILSMINGYAFAEIAGRYESMSVRTIGALAAIIVGFCWFWIWQGESRTWLGIVASTFGAILLPIAYISFFALMNSFKLLGDEKPTGARMSIWNLLMIIGVLGALLQAYGAISTKIDDPVQGPFVIGGVAVFLILALIGFSARPREDEAYD